MFKIKEGNIYISPFGTISHMEIIRFCKIIWLEGKLTQIICIFQFHL